MPKIVIIHDDPISWRSAEEADCQVTDDVGNSFPSEIWEEGDEALRTVSDEELDEISGISRALAELEARRETLLKEIYDRG